MVQINQIGGGGGAPSGHAGAPLAPSSILEGLTSVERGFVLAQAERTLGPDAAIRLAGGATVPPSGRIAEIAAADDPLAAAAFAAANPGKVEALKDALVAAGAHDAYHAVNTGITDRAVIDRAQERTADGGCAALSETRMLCNPAGPEIGEYTLPRQEGFPDYIGPKAKASHLYRAEASTIDTSSRVLSAIENRVADQPTPGDGWGGVLPGLPQRQNRATPEGAENDAGLPDFLFDDQVRSYTATDVNGNAVVANVTISGEHSLHPGIVSQGISQDADGTSITVIGEGNSKLSKAVNPMAEAAFQTKIERDIRAGQFAATQR